MVFSLSNRKPQSILKVVDIDRLKPGKSPQVKVEVELASEERPRTPRPDRLLPEEFLKTEPLFEDIMYGASDGEFFQDLGLWCSDLDKEEQTTITEPLKKSEVRAHTTDTPHTPISPLEWETFESGALGFLSPPAGGLLACDPPAFAYDKPHQTYLQSVLDIGSLPVVFSDEVTGVPELAHAPAAPGAWAAADRDPAHTYTTPFIDPEDSLENDMKYITWARDPVVEKADPADVVLSEFIVENKPLVGAEAAAWPAAVRAPALLSLDVAAIPAHTDVINTPDILSCVEQLESENFSPLDVLSKEPSDVRPKDDPGYVSTDVRSRLSATPSKTLSPSTLKAESPAESSCDEEPYPKKRRRRSEDSDETYTPYSAQPTRKYHRRKPSVPIEELIMALEDSQQQHKVRRGRPPKRRQSTVSSIGSVEDASRSSHELKYRELRDKNNEASKRSRMNRKLKELQMEHLAEDLERRNQQLKVKADILEDLTKRLKDALMQAMLSK